MYENDKRTVLTLDAGGTNFVFSAIRGNIQIVSPVCMPSCSDNLDRCLATLIAGFDIVKSKLEELGSSPVAISFAFPGPADYRNGVIGGNLPNFPSFRQGVALGPFLQHHYGIPVYIDEKGDIQPIEGVIDKDLASAMVGNRVKADEFYILTDVPYIYKDFKKPTEKKLEFLDYADTMKYLEDGTFAEGSMAPKIRACLRFVKAGGQKSVITEATKLEDRRYGSKITMEYEDDRR